MKADSLQYASVYRRSVVSATRNSGSDFPSVRLLLLLSAFAPADKATLAGCFSARGLALGVIVDGSARRLDSMPTSQTRRLGT